MFIMFLWQLSVYKIYHSMQCCWHQQELFIIYIVLYSGFSVCSWLSHVFINVFSVIRGPPDEVIKLRTSTPLFKWVTAGIGCHCLSLYKEILWLRKGWTVHISCSDWVKSLFCRAYEHAYNLLENNFLPLFHQSDDVSVTVTCNSMVAVLWNTDVQHI